MSGTVRVRRWPEVDAIAAKIRAHCDRDFAANLVPMDAEVDDFSIEGTGEFAAGGVLVLDEALESLSPYEVEAAFLTGEDENEPYELVVAPTTGVARRRLSAKACGIDRRRCSGRGCGRRPRREMPSAYQ
jgi:hypothetical protein